MLAETLNHPLLSHPLLFLLVVPVVVISEFGMPFPIFQETVLVFAGYKVAGGSFLHLYLILLTIFGSLIGSSMLYFLSKYFGEKVLSRYGFYRTTRDQIETSLVRYKKWEAFTIAGLRLIPGLYIPTTIVSGLLEIPYAKFATGVLISLLIYNLIFFAIGYFGGRNFDQIEKLSLEVKLILFLAAVIVLTLIIRFFIDRKAKN